MCNITITCDGCTTTNNSLIIPQGKELIFKSNPDGNNSELEIGDFVLKNFNGNFQSGYYQGGDKEDSNNYN